MVLGCLFVKRYLLIRWRCLSDVAYNTTVTNNSKNTVINVIKNSLFRHIVNFFTVYKGWNKTKHCNSLHTDKLHFNQHDMKEYHVRRKEIYDDWFLTVQHSRLKIFVVLDRHNMIRRRYIAGVKKWSRLPYHIRWRQEMMILCREVCWWPPRGQQSDWYTPWSAEQLSTHLQCYPRCHCCNKRSPEYYSISISLQLADVSHKLIAIHNHNNHH